MLRQILASIGGRNLRDAALAAHQLRTVTSKAGAIGDASEADFTAARKWASTLTPSTIPRALPHVRFDRSSGAGGQHVNKTDSKATITWSWISLKDYVPPVVHEALKQHRYYARSSDTIVIQAQTSRKQAENEEECHEKFFRMVKDTYKRVVPGETTMKQHVKVVEINCRQERRKLLRSAREATMEYPADVETASILPPQAKGRKYSKTADEEATQQQETRQEEWRARLLDGLHA